jgi:hypothetical protein
MPSVGLKTWPLDFLPTRQEMSDHIKTKMAGTNNTNTRKWIVAGL